MGGWRVCDACRIRACYRRMVHVASGVAGDLGGTVGDGPLARRAAAIRSGDEDRVGLGRRVGEVRSWRAEPRPCSGPFFLAHHSVRCAECSAVTVLPRVRFYVDSTEGSPLVRPHNAALARTQWANVRLLPIRKRKRERLWAAPSATWHLCVGCVALPRFVASRCRVRRFVEVGRWPATWTAEPRGKLPARLASAHVSPTTVGKTWRTMPCPQ